MAWDGTSRLSSRDNFFTAMAKKLTIYTIHPSFPITPFVGSTFFLDFFWRKTLI
jgi:hypothetical protein